MTKCLPFVLLTLYTLSTTASKGTFLIDKITNIVVEETRKGGEKLASEWKRNGKGFDSKDKMFKDIATNAIAKINPMLKDLASKNGSIKNPEKSNVYKLNKRIMFNFVKELAITRSLLLTKNISMATYKSTEKDLIKLMSKILTYGTLINKDETEEDIERKIEPMMKDFISRSKENKNSRLKDGLQTRSLYDLNNNVDQENAHTLVKKITSKVFKKVTISKRRMVTSHNGVTTSFAAEHSSRTPEENSGNIFNNIGAAESGSNGFTNFGNLGSSHSYFGMGLGDGMVSTSSRRIGSSGLGSSGFGSTSSLGGITSPSHGGVGSFDSTDSLNSMGFGSTGLGSTSSQGSSSKHSSSYSSSSSSSRFGSSSHHSSSNYGSSSGVGGNGVLGSGLIVSSGHRPSNFGSSLDIGSIDSSGIDGSLGLGGIGSTSSGDLGSHNQGSSSSGFTSILGSTHMKLPSSLGTLGSSSISSFGSGDSLTGFGSSSPNDHGLSGIGSSSSITHGFSDPGISTSFSSPPKYSSSSSHSSSSTSSRSPSYSSSSKKFSSSHHSSSKFGGGSMGFGDISGSSL